MKKIIPPYHYERLILFKKALQEKGFDYLSSGSFRDVYIRGGVVVKVPSSQEGLRHNIFEAYAWRKFRKTPTSKGALFAPCRLLSNGCLMMVTVDLEFAERLPNWANDIDREQVGIYNGRWVAYDFGIDVGPALEVEASNWIDIDGMPFNQEDYYQEMYDVRFNNAVGD